MTTYINLIEVAKKENSELINEMNNENESRNYRKLAKDLKKSVKSIFANAGGEWDDSDETVVVNNQGQKVIATHNIINDLWDSICRELANRTPKDVRVAEGY